MEKTFIGIVITFVIVMFIGLFAFGIPEYLANKDMEQDSIGRIDTIRIYEGLDTSYIDTIWIE